MSLWKTLAGEEYLQECFVEEWRKDREGGEGRKGGEAERKKRKYLKWRGIWRRGTERRRRRKRRRNK